MIQVNRSGRECEKTYHGEDDEKVVPPGGPLLGKEPHVKPE